jgi:o-succinylbenzoate synthase
METRDGFLVSVSDGEHTGYGEATPLPPWTETHQECEEALGALLERVGSHDSLEAVESEPNDEARTPAARYAVSVAVADLRAKRRGVPLYAYLDGGEARGGMGVDVNATVGDSGVEETLREVKSCVEEGYGTVKLKVGKRGVEEDAERVRRADEASDVRLRADANGAWDYGEASSFAGAVDDIDSFEYFEQPLEPDALGAHSRLRRKTGVDVALDESLTHHTVEDVIEEEAADYAVLKPMSVGGVGATRRVGIEARAGGVVPVVSNLIESVVGRTAAAHVAASIPVETECGLATGELLREDLGDCCAVKDGKVRLADSAGTGVEPEVKDAV